MADRAQAIAGVPGRQSPAGPSEGERTLKPYLTGGAGVLSSHGRTPATRRDRSRYLTVVAGAGVEWRALEWLRPRAEVPEYLRVVDGTPDLAYAMHRGPYGHVTTRILRLEARRP